jgi:hypothetical protein
MAKLSQCQRYTRFHHPKGWEVVYTGGTEATASIYLSIAFIYSTKQIKPCDFLAILGSNKYLVRKPFPITKNEHGIAWVNKSYATALDLKLGYYTIKIGLRRIQNLFHQPIFLLGAWSPTRINDGNNRFSWQAIVGANEIPRRCMSFPQAPPLHLLRPL